jgi:Zn-dependent peptidase ImmA (M78 family)
LTSERTELARQALKAAIRTRMELSAPPTESICVYDAAEKSGLEVRFVDIPSMEGMYIKGSILHSQPIILVSALRPVGRQASTVAHELGHHVFGHGTRIDQYIANAEDHRDLHTLEPEEMLAIMFAGFFLMPKAAVEHSFIVRGWSPGSATPRQVFSIAGWFGVGYGTLIHHMRSSLGMLSKPGAKALLSIQPKRIRQQILGASTAFDCFLVDHRWVGRPVDLQIGDFMLVDPGVKVESGCLVVAGTRADKSLKPSQLASEESLALPGRPSYAYKNVVSLDAQYLGISKPWTTKRKP